MPIFNPILVAGGGTGIPGKQLKITMDNMTYTTDFYSLIATGWELFGIGIQENRIDFTLNVGFWEAVMDHTSGDVAGFGYKPRTTAGIAFPVDFYVTFDRASETFLSFGCPLGPDLLADKNGEVVPPSAIKVEISGVSSSEATTTLGVIVQGDRGITLYYDNKTLSVDINDGSKIVDIKPGAYILTEFNASRTAIESTNLNLRRTIAAGSILYQASGNGPFTLTTTDA